MSTETFNLNRQLICATCLTQDRKLIAIRDSRACIFTYLELSLKLSDMICWECHSFLRRMGQFKRRAQTAQACLRNMKSGLQQDQPNLSTLTSSSGVSVDIPPDPTASTDIKADPLEVMIKQEFDDDEIKTKHVQRSLPDASTSYRQETQQSRGVPMSARVTVKADTVPTVMKRDENDDDIDLDDAHAYGDTDEDVEMSVLTHVIAPEGSEKNLLEKNTETEMNFTPEDIEAAVEKLPEKSRQIYNKTYENFIVWKLQNKMASFSENVFLAYFENLLTKFKPSSLWTEYSKLKATICIYHQVDISKYSKLLAFLNGQSEGFIAKKARTFTSDQLQKFIEEAPEHTYLLTKVAVIFGIIGACSRQQLYKFKINDVIDSHDRLIVHIMNNKNIIDRTFIITDKFYDICKKYMDLRPSTCKNPSFFLRYFNGKCYVQSLGINAFGQIGKTVATQLKLENPELYTSHCFRRTSASLVGDALILQPRKSATVEELESINKKMVSKQMSSLNNEQPERPSNSDESNVNTTSVHSTSVKGPTLSQVMNKNAVIHIKKTSLIPPITISKNSIQHLHVHFHK